MSYVQHPPRPRNHTRPIILTVLAGIISGVVLFLGGWFTQLPNQNQVDIVHKFIAVKDFFPGLGGLEHGRIILVMGVDLPGRGMNEKDTFNGVRTDTIMLLRLHPNEKRINVVSLPRDSMVYLAGGKGVNKLNAAFVYGGPQLTIDTIQETFGVTVDNYLVANVSGVKDLVNAVGGVDLYIDAPMHYRDRTAKLNIELEKGMNHLDGEKAEGYIRFRHDAMGDIGRIRRQQAFLQAFTKKLKSVTVLFNLKPLLDAKDDYVLTDMDNADLARLVMFVKEVPSDHVQVSTLPGYPGYRDGVSYWIINRKSAEQVLNSLIIGLNPEDNNPVSSDPDKVSIGLLYSQSQQKDIDDFRQRLTDKGYHVRCVLQVKHSRSQLVSHQNASSNDVLKDLKQLEPGLGEVQLIFSPHGSTFESNACGRTDYTLVLGDDIGNS